MWRKWCTGLLLTASLGLITGCWDRSEVEETSFVEAVGIDRGSDQRYTVTAVIARPAAPEGGGGGGQGQGGEGGGGQPYLVTQVESPTLAGAISRLSAFIDRRVSLLHAKAVFVGDELAQMGIMPLMDELTRFRQTRRTMFVIVTKGKASQFLSDMKPQVEKDMQRFIEQVTYHARDTGLIPNASQVHNFVTSVNTQYASPLVYYAALAPSEDQKAEPKQKTIARMDKANADFSAGEVPRKGGPNIEVLGSAAFRGERMVGVLTGEQTRMALILQDRFSRGYVNIPDPQQKGAYVSLDVRPGRPLSVAVDLSGPRPRLTVNVTLEAEILGVQSGRDYTKPELQPLLEAATAQYFQQAISNLVETTQVWNADIAGLGRHVVRLFPTVAAWEAYQWPARYQDAQVDVSIRVALRRFGLHLSPPRTALPQ